MDSAAFVAGIVIGGLLCGLLFGLWCIFSIAAREARMEEERDADNSDMR